MIQFRLIREIERKSEVFFSNKKFFPALCAKAYCTRLFGRSPPDVGAGLSAPNAAIAAFRSHPYREKSPVFVVLYQINQETRKNTRFPVGVLSCNGLTLQMLGNL
jgi:hypothetical protein